MKGLKNDLLLRALMGQQVERPPVWMMRQAGRYLPDYMKLKEKYGFFERVQNPALAAEITIQPVRQIGVDAAIIFSDILVVPQAMGLEVELVENRGPILPRPVQTAADLNRLHIPDPDALDYVFRAIQNVRQELNGAVPLIGFAGAPWTLFCYMVEGKGSKTFDQAKAFCYTQPALAHRILQMVTDTTIAFVKGQIRAGANVIQLFDSWGGLLGPDDFGKYSLPYIRQIIDSIREETLTIIFAKGAWHSLAAMSHTGAHGLGIDWCISPGLARKWVGNRVSLQGNLDPAKLLSPVPDIKREVTAMLEQFGAQRYIANLGHGILPNVPVDHARAFVDTVLNHPFEKVPA
jgi:uroporphyrinogen decarboxylase